jgi:hypothetical protein
MATVECSRDVEVGPRWGDPAFGQAVVDYRRRFEGLAGVDGDDLVWEVVKGGC